jgi:hypothetical protein
LRIVCQTTLLFWDGRTATASHRKDACLLFRFLRLSAIFHFRVLVVPQSGYIDPFTEPFSTVRRFQRSLSFRLSVGSARLFRLCVGWSESLRVLSSSRASSLRARWRTRERSTTCDTYTILSIAANTISTWRNRSGLGYAASSVLLVHGGLARGGYEDGEAGGNRDE